MQFEIFIDILIIIHSNLLCQTKNKKVIPHYEAMSSTEIRTLPTEYMELAWSNLITSLHECSFIITNSLELSLLYKPLFGHGTHTVALAQQCCPLTEILLTHCWISLQDRANVQQNLQSMQYSNFNTILFLKV